MQFDEEPKGWDDHIVKHPPLGARSAAPESAKRKPITPKDWGIALTTLLILAISLMALAICGGLLWRLIS